MKWAKYCWCYPCNPKRCSCFFSYIWFMVFLITPLVKIIEIVSVSLVFWPMLSYCCCPFSILYRLLLLLLPGFSEEHSVVSVLFDCLSLPCLSLTFEIGPNIYNECPGLSRIWYTLSAKLMLCLCKMARIDGENTMYKWLGIWANYSTFMWI